MGRCRSYGKPLVKSATHAARPRGRSALRCRERLVPMRLHRLGMRVGAISGSLAGTTRTARGTGASRPFPGFVLRAARPLQRAGLPDCGRRFRFRRPYPLWTRAPETFSFEGFTSRGRGDGIDR